MKISDIILELQLSLNKYGDLTVYYNDSECSLTQVTEIHRERDVEEYFMVLE